jgi:hypothetical protein
MLVRKLVVTACLAAPLALVSAQQTPPAKKDAAPPAQPDFPPLTGGELRLEDKDAATSADLQKTTRFANSTDPENTATAGDRPVLDKVVKYYLYRLTWEEVQESRDPQRVGTIPQIMNDIIGGPDVTTTYRLLPRIDTRNLNEPEEVARRNRQLAFVQLVTPSYLQYSREVLKNQTPIARVNAARVLAKLAEFGREEVVTDLVRIIKHPKESNAVRHWAFVGLEEIFSLVGTNDPRARGLFQSKDGPERLTAALTAVYEWLDANTKVQADKLQFISTAEQDGLRYVRRSAARALGAGRRPLIVDDRPNNQQAGPVADLLTRIVAADSSISPPPTLRERLDASLALAQLQASPSYQPDYAAFQIANFLVAFGTEANEGHNNFAWAYESSRLRSAFDTFSRRANNQYVTNFVVAARPLTDYLDNRQNAPDAVQRMASWVRDNRPANQQVYKQAEAR